MLMNCCGCGAVQEKNVEEIKEDIVVHDETFQEFAGLQIEEFQMKGRWTDNEKQIDEVECEITASDGENIHYKAIYNIVYQISNGRWKFDSLKLKEKNLNDITSDVTDDVDIDRVIQNMDWRIDEYTLEKHVLDPLNKTDTIFFDILTHHQLTDEYGKLEIIFAFDSTIGWYMEKYNYTNTRSEVHNDLVGVWRPDNEESGGFATDYRTFFEIMKVEDNAVYVNVTRDHVDGTTEQPVSVVLDEDNEYSATVYGHDLRLIPDILFYDIWPMSKVE